MRMPAAIAAMIMMAGCAAPTPHVIEFLTRADCVQTKVMRINLDEAIAKIGKPIPYSFVDLDTLPKGDMRQGYPTPTILVDGKDLFGMTPPAPPYPEPT
jgi:hypothetical protein